MRLPVRVTPELTSKWDPRKVTQPRVTLPTFLDIRTHPTGAARHPSYRQLAACTLVLDVISFGESAVADEGAGDAGEGQEVFGFPLVAAVQSAASGEPGHRAFYGPTVAAQSGRGLDALAGDTVPDAAPT